MRTKPHALCIGAGAVGRGLIAPKLIDAGFMVTFYDVDKNVIDRLDQMKYYPLVGRGVFKWIGPIGVYDEQDLICMENDFDYIFVSVKANNLSIVADTIRYIIENNQKKSIVYIIENLNDAAEKFSGMLNDVDVNDITVLNGIANVVVPISPHQEQDPTFTVYDPNMELVLEKTKDAPFINTARYVNEDEFNFEWLMKFYLHCSVHAFVAYWGIQNNFEYIHEVVTSSPHDAIVSGFIKMISTAMKVHYPDNAKEIDDRGKFEFKCMADHLMMDDVYRVARDPIRKLEYDERLIGLLYFLRISLGNFICDHDSYVKLVQMTNNAIDCAGLTPDSLLGEDFWQELPDATFDTFYYGVIEELRNDWTERFSHNTNS